LPDLPITGSPNDEGRDSRNLPGSAAEPRPQLVEVPGGVGGSDTRPGVGCQARCDSVSLTLTSWCPIAEHKRAGLCRSRSAAPYGRRPGRAPSRTGRRPGRRHPGRRSTSLEHYAEVWTREVSWSTRPTTKPSGSPAVSSAACLTVPDWAQSTVVDSKPASPAFVAGSPVAVRIMAAGEPASQSGSPGHRKGGVPAEEPGTLSGSSGFRQLTLDAEGRPAHRIGRVGSASRGLLPGVRPGRECTSLPGRFTHTRRSPWWGRGVPAWNQKAFRAL
jgi:hypothetical protein